MNNNTRQLIDKLHTNSHLEHDEYVELIASYDDIEAADYIAVKARQVRENVYGKSVYMRGLVEFTNICRNDCFYCGIRRSNGNADRYRLTKEQILSCTDRGYELGFRTFVLQGGEDGHFSDEVLCDIVRSIKEQHAECAVTLSVGERSYESYRKLKEAGADRYLLRHETATKSHYEKLHPSQMSFDNRMECLNNLRNLGYQVGCGFMVGSPGQTYDNVAADLEYIERFKPEMVGIGPFIPQKDTPFAEENAGTCEMTVFLLSIIRLIHQRVLLPATTALGTINPMGREKGILAGANVVMPNLSPLDVRDKYSLYDNKICTGDEAAECIQCLNRRMQSIGYELVVDRGDFKSI